MKFLSEEHKDFYYESMETVKHDDVYHRAFFYALGVNADTRNHVKDVFDIKNDVIKIASLDKGWQTSGSRKVCLFAFNMWNNFTLENETTPSNLFDTSYTEFFYESLKLRYPSHVYERTTPANNKGFVK
ncbi:MAG: DUF6075 family protein [Longicatena sp.]